MTKKITIGIFCLLNFLLCKINAQTYQTLNVTSGYNVDLIANGSGTAASSTTESVDSPTNGFVFMSTNFVNGSGATPASGLPSTGLINSSNTTGLPFQLASYSANNALKLGNMNDTGALNFGSTPKASKLYMLATTGNGSSTADIVVTFSDATTQTFTNQTINDWYGGASFAIQGIGRVSRIDDHIEDNMNDPRLYEIPLNISSVNQTKNISSVSVTKTSSTTGFLCVFGFSYQVANTCIVPDAISATNITSNSATVTWTAVSGSSTYELYRSLANVAPTSATSPTDSGITGASKNLTGLAPATSYYVWVRTNCGGGSTSEWSPVSANFVTLCGSVNPPYSENFDSSLSLPPCTSVETINATGGSWDVGNLNGIAGSTSNVIYSITQSMSTNTWFYTNGILLQAGTPYQLTYDYSNFDSQPGNLKVAYGTSPANASMTNIIMDYPNVNVGTLTPASFIVTPTTTGVYYFGFNDYTAAASSISAMFVDNISLINSSLSTSENLLKESLQVYPNPTSDYLYVKSAKKVAGMKVFDISGKIVLSSDKAEQKIDVSQLIKGTYLITIKNADGTSSNHKFIKK